MANEAAARTGRDGTHGAAALAVASVLVLVAAAAVPFSTMPLFPHPGFMPAFGGLILLADLLTAGLLFSQARLLRSAAPFRLGAAYLLSAALAVPHLLAFPGLLAPGPVIGTGVSAVWLWCGWHAGFPLGIILFVLGKPGPVGSGAWQRMFAAVATAAVLVTLLATAGAPWLPSLLTGGSYNRLNTLGIGPAILGVTLAAGTLVITRLRCRDTQALWLGVAMLAASLDVGLTLCGGGRFTLGWYVARLLSLVTGFAVLYALLSDLIREAGRVADANARLEALLRTDVLTNLANRRAFEAALAAEWRRAHREQTPLSLLMIDIDWFKGYNDRYGHPAGDACLRAVANALAGHVQRPADMAARLGGEEFGILLPRTDEAGARLVAERLRSAVAALRLRHEGSNRQYVSVSIGTATARPFANAPTVDQLVSASDRALYKAKAAGRDTVWSDGGFTLALVDAAAA